MPEGKLNELKAIQEDFSKNSANAYNYYDNQALIFKWLSRVTRTVSFVLVFITIWLTFSQKQYLFLNEYFTNSANASLFLIAITGVLVATDKLFIISSNWKRFTIAKLKIEELKQTAELKWKRTQMNVTEAGLSDADVTSLCDFYEQQLTELYKIQTDETSNWGNDLSGAMDSLKHVLESTKKQAEIEARNAADRAQQQRQPTTCVVEITIVDYENVNGDISITIGNAEFTRNPSPKLVFQNILVENNHVVARLGCKTNAETVFFEDATTPTQGGALAQLTFKIPA